MTSSTQNTLNLPQRQAVSHHGGPLLVLAGAGSGKTRVLTYRLAELVNRGIPPSRLLAVTFTNKAAQEMRTRVEQLLPISSQGIWLGTFHSIGVRILRLYGSILGIKSDFVIFDDQDQKVLCTQILKDLGLSERVTAQMVMQAIDQAKNQGLMAEAFTSGDYFGDLVARIYPLYQQRMRALNAVDFGDLLLLPLHLCRTNQEIADVLANRFDAVLIDEFQDVNQTQYQFVSHLARKTRQITAVGDDDQAIYGWRGADVQNLLSFERDWPDVTIVKLEQNYRSTSVILEAANAVISRNAKRHAKRLFTDKTDGERIISYEASNERDEASFVVQKIKELLRVGQHYQLADFAVFYRTNAQSRVLEESLRMADLPYTVVGGMRFYDRAEVRDILAYLRLCHNLNDDIALKRIINVPSRKIGEQTLNKAQEYAHQHSVSLWDALKSLASNAEIRTGTKQAVAKFIELIDELRRIYEQTGLATLAREVVSQTAYLENLGPAEHPETISRQQNVLEFLDSIEEFQSDNLADYLEKIALVSGTDHTTKGISLMTVHAAKGLEFKVVFVTGLEEGIFPSLRSRDNIEITHDPMAEERRLAYVAITRAREHLILTYAQQRRLYGQAQFSSPSRFLADIPKECLAPMLMRETEQSWRPKKQEHFTDDFSQEFYYTPRREKSQKSSSSTDSYIEYEPSEQQFYKGRSVQHEKFGVGQIREVSGFGGKIKLTVTFPGIGSKTILSNFVTLL